jgi:hypothetical protein
VYLDAELYDYVKASPSAIIQKALKQLKEGDEPAEASERPPPPASGCTKKHDLPEHP